MNSFVLDNQFISFEDLRSIVKGNHLVTIGQNAIEKITNCREYLDRKIENSEERIYGVNTGFGSLCDTKISKEKLAQLQLNLVRSHACGTGEEVPGSIVKIMLLLKAIGLSHGHSGVQLKTIERLLYFYNHDLIPVVYQQGSLGASGDLSPLAHIALALIGEGEVYFKGVKRQTAELYDELGLDPIQLKSKEGLALLNGTQFMSAYLAHACINGFELLDASNEIGSVSIDAMDGRLDPFQSLVNEIRNQKGQIAVASKIRELLSDSIFITEEKSRVQDPYCIRCIPQVHGATLDTINYAKDILEREINAVTDNPTIFPAEDLVISAGNFHGQPLALTLDFLAIAMAELGSISERRVYKLMSGIAGLPPFLVANPGLNSGFMIAQYTAASIVSQNKQLCTPASVDSIDSSNGQEDHVSMGANAATKLARVIENVFQILGIELMAAAQALQIRNIKKSSTSNRSLIASFRNEVPFIEEDQMMSQWLIKSKQFVQNRNR